MSETVKTKVGSDLILASVELSAEGEVHDAALSLDSMPNISLQPRLLAASSGVQNFSHVFDDLDVRKSGALSRSDSFNVAAGMKLATLTPSSTEAKPSRKALGEPHREGALRDAMSGAAFGEEVLEKPRIVDLMRVKPRVSAAIAVGGAPPAKQKQEDRLFVGEPFIVGGEVFVLYAVFDGHGDEDAAHTCMTHVQEVLERELGRSAKNMPLALQQTFFAMDALLQRLYDSKEGLKGGTTATLALINLSLGQALVANVGDSSAFAVTDEAKIALTVDHNTDNEKEVERVRASGGYVTHPDGYPPRLPNGKEIEKRKFKMFGVAYYRLGMQLKTTRALGDFAWKKDPPTGEKDGFDPACLTTGVIAEPHISESITIDRRMAIILASDGLWDFEDADKISVKVKEEIDADDKDKDVAKSLVDAVAQVQTEERNDNICCIVIIFDTP